MLRTAKTTRGKKIAATDGKIGHVSDFYFDDAAWVVRYMIVDTDEDLADRRVLIAPQALESGESVGDVLHVNLTRHQIEDAPGIDTAKPVSRQEEARYREYFDWEQYGMYEDPLGPGFTPPLIVMPPPVDQPDEKTESGEDPHLRSTNVVEGSQIEARGGPIGHIQDFILDPDTWAVRYLIVHPRDWLPGKRVLIAPEWVQEINWREHMIRVDLDRDRIAKAPPFTDTELIDDDYESKLRSYYAAA